MKLPTLRKSPQSQSQYQNSQSSWYSDRNCPLPYPPPKPPKPPKLISAVLLGDNNIGKRPVLRAIGGKRYIAQTYVTEGRLCFRRRYFKRVDEFRGIRVTVGSTTPPFELLPPYASNTPSESVESSEIRQEAESGEASLSAEEEPGASTSAPALASFASVASDLAPNANTNSDPDSISSLANIQVDLAIQTLDDRTLNNHGDLKMVFKDAQVIVLCYRTTKPKTLTNVLEKWFPIVAYFAHQLQLPIILLGIHPRIPPPPSTTNEVSLVKEEDINRISRRIGAVGSLQCRASETNSVLKAFKSLAWVGNHYDTKSRTFRPPIGAKTKNTKGSTKPAKPAKSKFKRAKRFFDPRNVLKIRAHDQENVVSPLYLDNF